MRWLDGIIDSTDASLSKTLGDSEGQGRWCATVHGVATGWTRISNGTTTTRVMFSVKIFIYKKKNQEIIIIKSEKIKKDKRLEFIKISHCDLAFLGTC